MIHSPKFNSGQWWFHILLSLYTSVISITTQSLWPLAFWSSLPVRRFLVGSFLLELFKSPEFLITFPRPTLVAALCRPCNHSSLPLPKFSTECLRPGIFSLEIGNLGSAWSRSLSSFSNYPSRGNVVITLSHWCYIEALVADNRTCCIYNRVLRHYRSMTSVHSVMTERRRRGVGHLLISALYTLASLSVLITVFLWRILRPFI
jgi:hypothetical protein